MKIGLRLVSTAVLLASIASVVLGTPAMVSGATSASAAAPVAAPVAALIARVQGDEPPPPAGLARFERLFEEEGWAQNSFHCAIQDRTGFLWFCTADGLLRYDGYTLKAFRYDPARDDSLASNSVYAILEDRQGRIWVGTSGGGLNRFSPDTETFTRYQHDPDNPSTSSRNNVTALMEDDQGVIWIGTQGGGLDRFNPETETFTHYQHDPNDPDSLSHDELWFLEKDRDGFLWIATFGGGLDRFDPASEEGAFLHYRHDPDDSHSLASDYVGEIYEDQHGNLWIGGLDGGLNRLDRSTGEFTHYTHNPADPFSLNSDIVYDIYPDRDGDLWIGSFGGGLGRFDPATGQVQRYTHDPSNPNSLSSDFVWFIFQDRGGILWIGTATGLNKLNPRTELLGHYKEDSHAPLSLAASHVGSIDEDLQGLLWFGGPESAGIQSLNRATGSVTQYVHDPDNPNSPGGGSQRLMVDRSGIVWSGTYGRGLDRFDPKTGIFTHYAHDTNDPRTISDNVVVEIFEDRSGTLWLGTHNGLNRMDRQHGQFVRYQHDPENPFTISDDVIQAIYEDRAGNLWIGTANGLNKMPPGSGEFEQYFHDPQDPNSLSHNAVFALLEDSTGTLWVGTDGGLNQMDTQSNTFMRFGEKDGLPSNSIQCILEDEAPPGGGGDLWLSTRRGLSRFTPTSLSFQNYDFQDGLQGNDFQRKSCARLSTGELAFGGSNGVNLFFPGRIEDNAHVPPIVLTGFSKFNRPVSLDQPLWEVTGVELSHQDSVFGFEFAALDYAAPDKNRYAYTMEGFDKDWTYVDSNRRFATYTNLDPGNYVFKVKGANSDGFWNEEGVAIKIAVAPPWWGTWWFRGTMLLLAVSLAFGGYRWRVHSIERRSRKLETQVVERTAELAIAKDAAEESRRSAETANRAKSVFLANMSHELRTPLNTVLGFSQLMQRDSTLSAEQRQNLATIGRSGEHLLALINDVLDLSKIEAGQVDLQVEGFDLYHMLLGLEDMFRFRAEQKGLTLAFERAPDVPQFVRADQGKLRQVLINLLGNGIKFTDRGEVSLRAKVKGEGAAGGPLSLAFEVEDTGRGIAPEELEGIFEAFVQTESGRETQTGTGLGLPISRRFVQLMGGQLSARSELGQGTTLHFEIPVEIADAAQVEAAGPVHRVVGIKEGQRPVGGGAYRLLITEDVADSRRLLVKLLQPFGFEMREAVDGQEAVEIWQEWQPHLIWMDMRMPVMDGREATRRIRSRQAQEAEAEGVVIVALTASAFEEERAEILASGCDGFIRKPFQEHEIFEMLHKHLGIELIYADEPESAADLGVLTADRLRALPGEWQAALQDAAEETNPAAANAVIQQIREQDEPLADALAELVRTYRFDIMQAVFEETRT